MEEAVVEQWVMETEEANRKDVEEARKQAQIAQEKVDQGGLHTASGRGHIGLVEDLIKRGAYVDYPDMETGKTALHFAVKRNRLEVVKLLLYHGADITIQDRDGLTPVYFSRTPEMNAVLEEASKQCEGNSQGDIHVDSVEVQSGQQTKLKNIGVSIHYPKGSGQQITYTCRRQAAEFSDAIFKIKADEEICSDTFVHRVSGTYGKPNAHPIITIPLFEEPKKDEVFVLKTDHGKEIPLKESDIYKKEEKWYCRVQENLRKFSSFVVVSRKKQEVFTIGKTAAKIVSTVNDQVELNIPENAFKEPTKLTIEISEAPTDQLEDSEDVRDVLSCTPFCSIDAGGQMPIKPICIKLPLPANFSGSADQMAILSMNEDEEDEDEDSWEFLDVEPKIDTGIIAFDVTSFSVKVAIQSSEVEERDKLKRQVSVLYRSSRRRTYSVVFLALVRQLGYTETFKMVVDCCQDSVAMERKRYWEEQGFQDQHPSMTAAFTTVSKQSYKVTLSDCFKILGPNQTLNIEFHAKRENYQVFGVEVVDPRSNGFGHVQIQQLPPNFLKGMDIDLPLEGFMLTNIVVELKSTQTTKRMQAWVNESVPNIEETYTESVDEAASYDDGASEMSVVTIKSEETIASSISLPRHTEDSAFLDTDFVVNLLKDVDKEWFDIYIFLGVTFKQIEKRLTDENKDSELRKLLMKWQKKARKRKDRGLRPLLSALKMGGRMDIRVDLLVQMKQWFDKQQKSYDAGQCSDNDLYEWIRDARKNPDILDPSGYPVPMSDQSLLLIAGCLIPSYELAKGLNISKYQLNDVMTNSLYSTNNMKVMKLLKLFLDDVPDQVQSLEALLKGLDSEHLTGARNYFAMLTKAWVRRSDRKDDILVQRMEAVLKKAI